MPVSAIALLCLGQHPGSSAALAGPGSTHSLACPPFLNLRPIRVEMGEVLAPPLPELHAVPSALNCAHRGQARLARRFGGAQRAVALDNGSDVFHDLHLLGAELLRRDEPELEQLRHLEEPLLGAPGATPTGRRRVWLWRAGRLFGLAWIKRKAVGLEVRHVPPLHLGERVLIVPSRQRQLGHGAVGAGGDAVLVLCFAPKIDLLWHGVPNLLKGCAQVASEGGGAPDELDGVARQERRLQHHWRAPL
mmetsp:Transcript_22771/g.52472  ORF Transcript_22771/g.52472 Transcript_22771/m.52472 type:complete len:248 (-) Transcript_22771:1856-2599(-)